MPYPADKVIRPLNNWGQDEKTPGGEGERIEFHARSMRQGRPVLAGVGVNGLSIIIVTLRLD